MCRKEESSNESDDGDDGKQQSQENCSESPVDSDSLHTEQAIQVKDIVFCG